MTEAGDRVPPTSDAAAAVFPARGELGRLCQALDWSRTALGPVENWPESLRTVAGLVVASPFPLIVLWGPELVQIYNDGYRQVMGAKHPAGLGQPTRECWPEVWQFNAPLYEGVRERWASYTFEDQRLVIHRHGYPEEAYFKLSFSPVPGEGGVVGGVLVTVLETTAEVRARELNRERERAEAALRDARDMLAMATAASRLGWGSLDLATGAMRWDRRGREIVGLASDSPRTVEAWLERIHPEDRARVQAHVAECIAENRPFDMEYRVVDAAGTMRHVHGTGAFTVAADGKAVRGSGLVRDVTAAKQAEASLRAREQAERELAQALAAERATLAAVIEHLPVGVGIGDPEGTTLSLNRAGLAIHGFASEAEMFARLEEYTREFDLRHLDGRPMPLEQWPAARAIRGDFVTNCEVRLLDRVTGVERVVSYDVAPVRDAAGGVVLVVYVMQDLTDKKQGEAALRAAKEAAERASTAKTQFLSTISHELRTPLTAVIGLSDLMASEVVGPLNERQKDYLQRVRTSSWHLVSIIDEILTFSRAEAGKETVELARADVAEIARGVAGMFVGDAAARGLDLHTTGADDRVVAVTDAGKVRQILFNLVGNALKYTTHGTVEVELYNRQDWLEFSVRDTGPGIPEDRLDDIFQPFVQIDQSSTRMKGGTGLGLAICRRLARLLGGDVSVESTLGSGSTFTLRLPCRSPARN